jgi:hypothetical protein
MIAHHAGNKDQGRHQTHRARLLRKYRADNVAALPGKLGCMPA